MKYVDFDLLCAWLNEQLMDSHGAEHLAFENTLQFIEYHYEEKE